MPFTEMQLRSVEETTRCIGQRGKGDTYDTDTDTVAVMIGVTSLDETVVVDGPKG